MVQKGTALFNRKKSENIHGPQTILNKSFLIRNRINEKICKITFSLDTVEEYIMCCSHFYITPHKSAANYANQIGSFTQSPLQPVRRAPLTSPDVIASMPALVFISY